MNEDFDEIDIKEQFEIYQKILKFIRKEAPNHEMRNDVFLLLVWEMITYHIWEQNRPKEKNEEMGKWMIHRLSSFLSMEIGSVLFECTEAEEKHE